MKRILLALFILIATSSLAQVTVVGYVSTLGVANYPTHIDSMGKGGYVVVRDTTQRNAITCLRRKYGMAAYVQSLQKLYILKDSNCANTWVEFTAGSGGVSKITAGTNITISPIGGTGDVTINAEGGGFSQGLQSVIDVNDSLNVYGFHFRTPIHNPYAVSIITNPSATYAPNLIMPATSGTIALEGNQNRALTYIVNLTTTTGTSQVKGNSYSLIEQGSDTGNPADYGFLEFENPTPYDGQRITIVNRDTAYQHPAYILQSGYVPVLEGTNEPVTCIPYGLTYEFVSVNGTWHATASKQRETRYNLVPNLYYDYPSEHYPLNSCNAIYQFLGFTWKDYVARPIGTIDFPPAYYLSYPDEDTIPINDGQRITIINDQYFNPIRIGLNKPSKQFAGGFYYDTVGTIPPQTIYEFVSVGGKWRLVTPIAQPVDENGSPNSFIADFYPKTYGIYPLHNISRAFLPDSKAHNGESITFVNISSGTGADTTTMEIATLSDYIINPNYPAGGGVCLLPPLASITLVAISGSWAVTSFYIKP